MNTSQIQDDLDVIRGVLTHLAHLAGEYPPAINTGDPQKDLLLSAGIVQGVTDACMALDRIQDALHLQLIQA